MQDRAMPMQDVAVFFKKPLLPHQVDPRVAEFKAQLAPIEFESLEQFQRLFEDRLAQWLPALVPSSATA